MTARLVKRITKVPLQAGEDVTVKPGYPWPSAYRGSKYSIIDSPRYNQYVLSWRYDDLQIYLEPPSGLVSVMQNVGKSNGAGTGSFRITADREVLTKVRTERYIHSELAPSSEGWTTVYLGKLEGELDFTDVNNHAPSGTPPSVWEGLPFHHGETWAVSVYNNLIWKKEEFRFQSAFDHSELIQEYSRYREMPGRIYINENGCVWANIPPHSVPSSYQKEITNMYNSWRQRAKRENMTSNLRLVRRRLKATGDGDSDRGHLPVFLGHLSDFDGGVIPRPVVDDTRYFIEEGSARD